MVLDLVALRPAHSSTGPIAKMRRGPVFLAQALAERRPADRTCDRRIAPVAFYAAGRWSDTAPGDVTYPPQRHPPAPCYRKPMFGYFPRIRWNANEDGSTRSLEEAVSIAQDHGVAIPNIAAFFVDDFDELDASITARGPKVTKPTGGIVVLDDLLNRFGQVPFLVRRDILNSDEAIVAVFAHEMHELVGLLPRLRAGQLTIEQFNAYTSATNHGNLHFEAWDIADRLVEKMRRKRP